MHFFIYVLYMCYLLAAPVTQSVALLTRNPRVLGLFPIGALGGLDDQGATYYLLDGTLNRTLKYLEEMFIYNRLSLSPFFQAHMALLDLIFYQTHRSVTVYVYQSRVIKTMD